MKTSWFITCFMIWVKCKKPHTSGRYYLLFFSFSLLCCVKFNSDIYIYISYYNYFSIFKICLFDFIIICLLFSYFLIARFSNAFSSAFYRRHFAWSFVAFWFFVLWSFLHYFFITQCFCPFSLSTLCLRSFRRSWLISV